jgi:hypothetical protein
LVYFAPSLELQDTIDINLKYCYNNQNISNKTYASKLNKPGFLPVSAGCNASSQQKPGF